MKLAPARGARPPGGTGHQRARHLRIPRLPLARRTNDSFNGWSHAQVAWWDWRRERELNTSSREYEPQP